jgi:hypothetical protein
MFQSHGRSSLPASFVKRACRFFSSSSAPRSSPRCPSPAPSPVHLRERQSQPCPTAGLSAFLGSRTQFALWYRLTFFRAKCAAQATGILDRPFDPLLSPRHVITFFSCDVPLPPTASSDSFPKSSFSFSAHGAFYGDLFSVRVAGFS